MIKKKNRKHITQMITTVLVFAMTFALLPGCRAAHTDKSNDGVLSNSASLPPVNEDGFIVITMPITLLGGNPAKELQKQHEAKTASMSEEEIERLAWTKLVANEDGSLDYYFTPEQFERTKAAAYMAGQLIDAATNAYPAEYIKDAEYTDIDENDVPWGLTVWVDGKEYTSFELVNSYYVTLSPAVYLGMFQILSGVPGDEWAVHVTVKDAETDEIISETDFPTRTGAEE